MIRDDLGGIYLAVISSNRPHNVVPTTAIIGPATWFVPEPHIDAYKAQGALVEACWGGVAESRNRALDEAFRSNAPCLQVDDDVKRVERILGKKKKEEIPFSEACGQLLSSLRESPFHLAGMAPTNNQYFFNPERPVKTKAFIIGSFCLTLPTPLRFDPKMPLKEDYDYTCQHIARYGGVIRDDTVSLDFAHYTNKGGCQDYRTPEKEQEAIALLKAKWGPWIRDHHTRENEVLLKVK